MCLGLPMRIEAVDGPVGMCMFNGARRQIDLSLLPDARAGDHVLVFLDVGRRLLGAEEASLIADALAAVEAVMAGAPTLDVAFADLAGREPALPAHLEAARCAGLKQG